MVMSSEELSFEELKGAAVINVAASRSWHLLRRIMEPPAVSTTYDLGSAHFSLTVPLNHVFDGQCQVPSGQRNDHVRCTVTSTSVSGPGLGCITHVPRVHKYQAE